MFINRDMWKGNPPADAQEAARRRCYFLSLHDLPQKGWNLQAVTDSELDFRHTQCEVCGMSIRWNAHISHPGTRDDDGGMVRLRVGLECRTAITGPSDAADQWERQHRNRLTRRASWLKGWKTVTAGQSAEKKTKGGRVVVMRTGPTWSYSVRQHYRWEYGPKVFASSTDAALAAFDRINPAPEAIVI